MRRAHSLLSLYIRKFRTSNWRLLLIYKPTGFTLIESHATALTDANAVFFFNKTSMRILVLCTFVLILLFDITPEISAKICIYETRYGLQKICQNDYECWSHCMNDKRGTGDCDDHRRCICQRRFPRKPKNPRNENDLNKWFIED